MKKLICSILLIAAPTFSWAEFNPEFSMRMGYDYNDLFIDIEKTRELGGANLDDPQLYLQYEDAGEYWGTPTVIASPSSGVCGIGYYSRPVNIGPDDLAATLTEVLNVHMKPITKKFGSHLLELDGVMVAPELEVIVSQLESKGIAQLMSPGNERPDVMLSLIDAQYNDGILVLSGGVLYSNIEDCLSEIYGVSP